jgi:signal transduction histidine kinase
MSLLMQSLGNRQYQGIPAEQVDPMFQILFENYNTMVQRLARLENEHLHNEQDLQRQVDNATRTLIGQQRSLANTERLAALGEVMAHMAHELRNPLAGVQMACSNLKTDMAGKHEYEKYLARISLMCSEINRMIDLLNNLLTQARHDPEPLSNVDLNATIQDLLTLARYQMPEQIELRYQPVHDINCKLPDIQFRQALLNLILNARQAMAEKAGSITLEVSRQDDTLNIRVTDEGPGFPAEIIDGSIRAFSTQRQGGTGLGLSVVKRFARNHDGKLSLNNLSSGGACVTLELPCT